MFDASDTVDRTSPVPLHNQLYHLIKEEFTTRYQSGELLPTEVELASRFQVGRGTVRNALKVLTSEGIIERIAGRGTFLTDDSIIRLTHYKVAVLLSRAEFAPGNLREETWVHHLEMLNGMMEAQAGANVSLELIAEESLDRGAVFDGILLFRKIADELAHGLTQPSVEVRYEIDLARGFALVADDLVAQGYQKPVFVGNPNKGRLEAVNEALRLHGRDPLPPQRVVECEGTEEAGAEAARRWFAEDGDSDCFVCSTDLRALGVLSVLKERGLEVGRQAGVYGFDGIRKTLLSVPALTTVSFDWKYAGGFAVRDLRARLDSRPRPSFVVPQGKLLIRESTRGSDGQ